MTKNSETSTESSGTKVRTVDVSHTPDPDVDPRVYSLGPLFTQFLQEETFLGALMLGVPKTPDWKCDTAYVAVNRHLQIVMRYNPSFMLGMPMNHQKGVVKHEIYHIVLRHILERRCLDTSKNALWNIATDLAINSLIGEKNLPSMALMPGIAPQNCQDPNLSRLIASFPRDQSADWYMERLTEFAEQQGGGKGNESYSVMIGNENGETMDSHGEWGNIPEEARGLIKEKIDSLIREGATAANTSNRWGSVPSWMKDEINQYITKQVDWRSLLKLFMARCRSQESTSTVRRINKKMPYKFPGSKKVNHARVLIAIDQSGSMSDESVALILGEAFSCSTINEIDIVNFDVSIDEDSFKTVKNGKKFPWIRTRCGGTSFDCVREFAASSKNRGKWDGIIIATDGYAPTMGRTNHKVLWLIIPGGSSDCVRPGDFVVKMDNPKKVTRM
ncbi:hypothetical protein EPO17_03725 [Patescibacteria group bacterium]|nr:MAG: hypothetical protein EPO17_03725 [Patescibacteria group bacterium]